MFSNVSTRPLSPFPLYKVIDPELVLRKTQVWEDNSDRKVFALQAGGSEFDPQNLHTHNRVTAIPVLDKQR